MELLHFYVDLNLMTVHGPTSLDSSLVNSNLIWPLIGQYSNMSAHSEMESVSGLRTEF